MSAIDNETFSRFIREYTPALYRLAYGILYNREDAEDVVSESVLKAYEKLHTLRKAESFRAWIMQIAVNEARRAYGRRKRYAAVENVEEYMPAFEDIKSIICNSSSSLISLSGKKNVVVSHKMPRPFLYTPWESRL